MKNKREIILDFTSLLDVIMLILFFFVIFAQFDTSKAIENAEALQTEAKQKIEDASDEWEAANKAKMQAEEKSAELQQANALAESIIINGSASFDRALRLKLALNGERDHWSISVHLEEENDNETVHTKIGTISDVRNRNIDDMAKDFENIIIEYGYSKDDAFLCDLVYNSNDIGSRIAKDNTDDMLKIFQDALEYNFLFVSRIDLSRIGDN